MIKLIYLKSMKYADFCSTLNSAYIEKKYVEILLHYRWLFIKGNIIISEWGEFDVEIFLHYSQFFH